MGKQGKHAGGRPSKYSADVHVPWGRSLAKRGCTDEEIAEAFGITVRTLYGWKGAHPEFLHALKESKSKTDEAVAESLFNRACGNCVRETRRRREVLDSEGKKVVLTEVTTEKLPPDTTAMIFWLKNRQPQLWRDKPVEQVDESSADAFLEAWRDA